MQTIGIIGGMSWESTQLYYQLINQGVKERLGGLHSAQIILYSVDFAQIERLQATGDWTSAAEVLSHIAQRLQVAGADGVLIATNTMHKVAEEVQRAVSIPLLHIAEATGTKLRQDGRHKTALLGTRFTMEDTFYTGKLESKYGLEVLIPSEQQCVDVHRIIFQELCQGEFKQSSRTLFCKVIDDLVARGADSVVLGCTEISLLISANDTDSPLYDTTALHAEAAVKFLLKSA